MASSSDAFPAGLRVLVVDHDSACLNTLQKMLIKCNYQVSTCSLAQEALDLLENRRDGFDIVMSDVDVLDMDGFKFLEQVGMKMDLPVIMMSVDGETSRVMKGVQHGACDYLLKPIRMKELRNIWQHVFRKRMRQVSSVEAKESVEETLKSDDSSTFSGDMAITCKKRKDFDQKSIESIDPSSMKKARVVWTSELHSKFLMAVDHIGLDKVGPKKILDLMGVPWLTRENVASHLQKYRLNLSRMQKENGMKLSRMQKENGMKLPNSVTLHQNIVINENYASAAGQQIHIHGQVGGILSMPLQAEGEKPLFGDFLHPEMNRNSRIGFDQPFELLKAESKIQAHYTSSSLIKSHFQPGHRFDQFPLVTHNQGQSRREVYQDQNQAMKANTNHFYNKNKSYAIGTDHHHTLLSFPDQGYLTHCHNSINHDEEQNLQNNLESSLKNMIIVGTGTTSLRLRDVELNPYANDMYLQNTQHVNLESFGGSSKEEKIVATDAQLELYEAHNFEYEKNNGVECYARDQDLYFR